MCVRAGVYIKKYLLNLLNLLILLNMLSLIVKYQKVTCGRSGGNKMAIPTFLIFVERLSRPNRDLTASSLLSKCK